MTEPKDLEVFARAQLDAARKDLLDCLERENIASETYVDAVRARESAAFNVWSEALPVPTGDFKALLISNKHLHALLEELRKAAKEVLRIAFSRELLADDARICLALEAAIAKVEESGS